MHHVKPIKCKIMGEYLRIKGESVKIGTCEDLYYTTIGQLKDVVSVSKEEQGSSEPNEYLNIKNGFRYRFPFPDEFINIGDHQDFDRGVLFTVPKSLGIEIAHGNTFFRTDEKAKKAPAIGFRLPCVAGENFPVKRFDWSNVLESVVFEIVQQKQVNENGVFELQTVVRCPYCGERCRLDRREALSLFQWVWKYRKQYGYFQTKCAFIALRGYLRGV